MKRLTGLFLAIAVVCLTVSPARGTLTKKERDWQEGKLIDIQNESIGAINRERIIYVIDAGNYIYTASRIHYMRAKSLLVTVNDKIKFALEKSKFYILDEEGKEHELKFEKKALKDSPKEELLLNLLVSITKGEPEID